MKYTTLFILISLFSIVARCQEFDPEKDFPYFDTNGDGDIVFEEFLGYVKKLPEIEKNFGSDTKWVEALEILFEGLDEDKDKSLKGEEFVKFVEMMKELDEMEKKKNQGTKFVNEENLDETVKEFEKMHEEKLKEGEA